MVIDWQYPVMERTPKEVASSSKFLKKLMEALLNKPLMRIPVSTLCYVNPQGNVEYLASIFSTRTLIVQIHGTGYRTYEDFFTRTSYPTKKYVLCIRASLS